MQKYAIVVDDATKKCTIGQGDNIQMFVKCGMMLQEVEQGIDGNWYLLGFAPQKTLYDAKVEKLKSFISDNEAYRKKATVEFEGKNFSISQDAKINLMAVISQASAFGGKINYFEKNGNSSEYTLEEFMPIAATISKGIAEAETYYYNKETEIKSAQSFEELEAVTWLKL